MSSKAPSERAQSVKPEDKAEGTPKKTQKSGDADGEDPYKLPEENGKAANAGQQQKLPFPGATDLNSRLRRLIAAFQRESKKIEQKQAQIDKRNERRERIEQVSLWKNPHTTPFLMIKMMFWLNIKIMILIIS